MDKRQAKEKFEQSKMLFAQKRYPEAMIALDELNAAFPNERHIMYARAMCLEELQRPLEAIQICEQAVAMHNDEKSQKLLARLRREHGPIQEGPTDLASLTGQGAGPSPGAPPPMAVPEFEQTPGGPGGLPDIPSIPDMPDYSAAQGQGSSSKRFYIILGVVVGVLLLVLIGLPLVASMMKGDEAPGPDEVAVTGEPAVDQNGMEGEYTETPPPSTTETPVEPAAGMPQEVQWYYNYDEGRDIAWQYNRPICIFFYDGGTQSTEVEQQIFQDPGISQTLSQFINIRVLYSEDNQAVINYGVAEVPVIVIENLNGEQVYSAWGDEIYLEDVRAALNLVQVDQVVSEFAEFGDGASAIGLILFLLVSLFLAPWPLYLTLLFTGKLPHGEFLKDFFSVALVAIGANAIASVVPCFGFIILIWILHSVYDMGLIDFLIYFAISVVLSFLYVAGVIAIFGAAFFSSLPVA